MPRPFARREILLRIASATETQLNDWAYGVWAEKDSGRTISELRDRVVSDRLALAERFRISAQRCLTATPPMYRDSVSRSYYAMYHAARALLYFQTPGDDFQAHELFWKHVPEDLGEIANVRNHLKTARLRRNEADYDPYPKSDSAFKNVAVDQASLAARFLRAVRNTLQAEGCAYL